MPPTDPNVKLFTPVTVQTVVSLCLVPSVSFQVDVRSCFRFVFSPAFILELLKLSTSRHNAKIKHVISPPPPTEECDWTGS